MAIDKVKLPDNSVEEVRDSRIPGIDSAPTSGSGNLVTSGGVKSALDGYLPLTGGTLNSGSSSPTLILNTSAADSAIKYQRGGSDKAWIGYSAGAGVYLYNCIRSRYLSYKDDGSLLFENNKVWHAGNDGDGSGLDADLLDGWHGEMYVSYNGDTLGDNVDFNAITYKRGSSIVIQPIHVPNYSGQTNYPYNGYGQMLTFGGQESLFPFRIAHIDNSSLYYQCAGYKYSQAFDFSGGSAWEQIAFTSSNVASSTKLETPRTIWGQSFDGTADISGAMTGVTTVNSFINAARGDSNVAYLYLTNVYAAVDYAHIFVSNSDKSTTHRPLVLQNGYGNVGVGIPNPSYKLDVAGDIRGTSVTTTLQTSQPSGGMLPNRQYALGELSGDTTFSMAAGTSGVTNHYFWTFSTPSTAPTITWPAAITSWYGGSAPTINASKHYEVSVLNGVAVVMEV